MRLFSDEGGDPRTGLRCQTAARTHRGGTFGKAHQTMTRAYPLDRARAWCPHAEAPMHSVRTPAGITLAESDHLRYAVGSDPIVIPPRPGVHNAFTGQGNASSLPLLGVLQFDLGDTKQQTGNQMPHRTVEVNLLRDRDDPYSTLAPVCQHVDTFLEVAGHAVKLPDYNGGNLSGKNGGLQLLEHFPLYGVDPTVVSPGAIWWRGSRGYCLDCLMNSTRLKRRADQSSSIATWRTLSNSA